jgi:glucokinase
MTDDLSGTDALFIGFDIGGTRMTAALGNAAGDVLEIRRRRTGERWSAQAALDTLAEMVGQLQACAGQAGRGIARIGIGFGGPVDAQRGIVRQSHHVEGWEGTPLPRLLEKRHGIPAVMDNDANAGGLGEALYGAGRGARDLLYVNIGTGIGGGVVIGGRVHRGATTTAGEIGHTIVLPGGPPCTCGKRGCLESLCSGWSIARRAREAVDEGRASGSVLAHRLQEKGDLRSEDVFEAARAGDACGWRLLDETAEYLGIGIGNAVNLLDPERVILGGGVAEAGELLLGPVREAIRRVAMPAPAERLRVVGAQLGYDAGVRGALALAIHGL